MILDEPTNHLDIEAVNALIIALNNYEGGIVIVSHDEFLINSCVEDIYYIKNQLLHKYPGDFNEYRKALINKKI